MIVGDGRPLRFLALVGGGWLGVRILFLWHAAGSLPEAVRGVLPLPVQAIAATPVAGATPIAALRAVTAPTAPGGRTIVAPVPVAASRPTLVDPIRVQLALLALTRIAGSVPDDSQQWSSVWGDTATMRGAVVESPTLPPAPSSRWSVSSWMIARRGGSAGERALAPQLGGTQGGVRIDYALGAAIAATGRLAAPAAGAGREVSLGLAWRPAGVPLRFVAEQRIALDGGRSGPALGVSGGVSAMRLPAGFRLEGYGQAGAIARAGIETYVDASVRATRPIAERTGITLDAGGGAWGGAQRGVSRVDIGPSIGAAVPLAGRPLRISLDWRQRIVGNARPGSGLALSLGTDF